MPQPLPPVEDIAGTSAAQALGPYMLGGSLDNLLAAYQRKYGAAPARVYRYQGPVFDWYYAPLPAPQAVTA